MTQRERFRETLLFGKPDKIPLEPGYPREATLAAWHKQGLAEEKDYYHALLEILGIEPEPKEPEVNLEVSFQMIPEFEEKVLEHKNGHYIVQEMIDFWTRFVSETIAPILKNVEVDQIFISEDMAYKGYSMISPEMVRKFLLPTWKSLVLQIKK